MAISTMFVCTHCKKSIESWSDANAYYLDDKGQKQYVYHPYMDDLSHCIGNDDPHLCLDCGHEFMIDSLAPTSVCLKCESANIISDQKLNGEVCPCCKKGTFKVDPFSFSVS